MTIVTVGGLPFVAKAHITWPLGQVGGAGVHYMGGFYDFAASDNDFSPATTLGTANLSYAAHVFVVLGAVAVDEISITVTGTTISNEGVRNAGPDTEVITIPNEAAVDSYFETSKHFIGQVSIETTAGTAKTCNFGFAKYWDNNNGNFAISGLEVTWIGGASDNSPNIELLHHSASGWTYNVGSEPTPPTPVASMQTDHNTEIKTASGVSGSWKRTNLNTPVAGSNGEGTIFRITTTAGAGKAFETGGLVLVYSGSAG